MDIEILEVNNMSFDGSSVLRTLQNNSTPHLDMLIRESIQNSLDARKENETTVEVDYSTGSFRTVDFTQLLKYKEIENKVNNRYPEVQQFLSISDTNTEGLTGPLTNHEISEDGAKGNWLKLVHNISNPQEKEGAGGAWGYGKTIYFRIGIGFVVYYSRILNENNTYEERLAISYVEDQKKEDAILPYPPNHNRIKTGIAWWGEACGENRIKAITNSTKIHEVLDIFGIEPYCEEKTGTIVIVPFVDEQGLLLHNRVVEDRDYYDDMIEYLKYAAQRWYIPKLNNEKVSPNLRISFNKQQLYRREEVPFFRAIRSMYNFAITEKNENEFGNPNINYDKLKCLPINLNEKSLDNRTAGYLVFGKFSYKELGLENIGDKGDPFLFSGIVSQATRETNPPLICYTRDLGMIINYEFNGSWVDGIPSTSRDEYIIGIFVLNSANTLNLTKPISLNEYVRGGEMADHQSWSDYQINGKKYTLIERVQNNIRNKIKNEMSEPIKQSELTDLGSRLSRMLGNSILPKRGIGNRAIAPTKPSRSGSVQINTTKIGETNLLLTNSEYTEKGINVPFTIKINTSKNVKISFSLSISKNIGNSTIEKYEDDTELVSPIQFGNVEMYYDRHQNYYYNDDSSNFVCEKSKRGTTVKLSAILYEANQELITGDIEIFTVSKNVSPDIKVELEEI